MALARNDQRVQPETRIDTENKTRDHFMKLTPVRIIAAAVAVAGLILIWLLLRSTTGDAGTHFGPGTPAAVAVRVEPVRQEAIRDIRRFTGTLYPSAQFEVAPRIGGRLAALLVDIGDRVRQGQVIARLDDDEYVQQVEQAEAEVEVARAGLTEARSSLEEKRKAYARSQELRRQKIASEAELDAARAAVAAGEAQVSLAAAQVKQRRAALEAARVRLGYTTITADWKDGGEERVVGERYVDEGTTISANTPIVSVLDIRDLVCVIYVTERDYPRLDTGQPVTITADAFPGRRFGGTITRIAPLFRETSRQARVEIHVPNQDGLLKPGMFVSANVELQAVDRATVIPAGALVQRGDQNGVFLADRAAGKARFQPVVTGITEGDRVQVVEPAGLAGEVVTLGQHLLSDGTAILISGADASGGEE